MGKSNRENKKMKHVTIPHFNWQSFCDRQFFFENLITVTGHFVQINREL